MSVLVACGLTREAKIIARDGVVVVVGGGIADRLENALEDILSEYASEGWRFSAILSCGVAGALDPRLRAGDVVVGSVFSATLLSRAGGSPEPHVLPTPSLDSGLRGRTGPVQFKPHPGAGRGPDAQEEVISRSVPSAGPSLLGPGLRRGGDLEDWLAQTLPKAHLGTVVGAGSIVASVAEKAALYAATGAIAVDMESHVAARVAARHGLPFATVRTISDSADHALPPAALVGMKPDGGVALGAILGSLARNPAQLPALLRTGRDAGAAFRALREAIGTLDAAGIGAVAFENNTLDA